ncbi:L-histidine N(alpha)-methyltransferase, partial [bacterium]|nr:L-histidine N(alpha)-methyltransferase [bacterium]
TLLPDLIREHSVDIVELASGDGHKTRLLIDGFLQAGRSVNYFPIDISAKAMELLEDSMPSHPQLQQHNIVAEYFDGIDSINQLSNNRKLVLFLGSNIGNFSHSEAKEFLRHLQYHLNPGDYLLAGFDLKKDIATLNTAYNDSSGLTRDFNLNLLHRINKELHADFDVEAFDHYGTYNPTLGAMESYLLSKSEQTVNIKTLGKQINFTAYEPIHVEYSFKYLPTDIEQLADDSGFLMLAHFPDSQHYFIDSLWRATT